MNQGHSAAWDQLWDQAASFYRMALEEFPNHPQALTSLGLALYEMANYQEALQYPSLNVRGMAAAMVGAKAATIIPSHAVAELDLKHAQEVRRFRVPAFGQHR